MYYYFFSDVKRAIFLSGVYLGVTGNEPKKCDVLNKNTFIEAVSISNPNDSFRFVLSDEIINNPPKDLVVTDLKGGYLLHFKSRCVLDEFKIIAQEKSLDAVITVFSENGIRLSIENAGDFYATTIYENVESAKIKRLSNKRLVLIAFSLKNYGERIMIFDLEGKIKKLYDNKVTSHTLDKELRVKTSFKDIKKHVTELTLDFFNNEIIETSRVITHDENFNKTKILPSLIPYVFLEDLLVGDDYLEYLSEDIKQKKESLKEYLGAFCAVIPPPLFRNSNEIGLVFKKTENKYYVEYVTFTIENSKITNLKKLEY